MSPNLQAIARAMRRDAIDAELVGLVWVLAECGLPVHVATDDPDGAANLVAGLEDVVKLVHVLTGSSLEQVIDDWKEEAARLGIVLVVADGRVTAAHWVRPPIRDGAGHVRAQGPAVLAVWDERAGRFEHFAWGVIPELAAAIGRKAGDLEADVESRRIAISEVAILAS